MAYLSDNDEENQQNAQQGQSNFNIFAPASSGTKSSPQSTVSSSNQGGGQSSDTSNKNAQSYTQSFSGTTGNGGGDQAQPTNLHQPASSVMGFGSSTPGGGYINFSSYANANPSSSGAITSAGNKLVGNETTALNKATNVDPNSGFSTAIDGAPKNAQDIGKILGTSGADWDAAKENVSGWLNESYTAPSVNYSPSEQWQTYTPELSETPTMGGANKPSVIDYLAQPDIAAGNYNLGERSLDQALISADPRAQAAIKQNAGRFSNFDTNAAKQIGDLQSQFDTNQSVAEAIKNGTSSALNDYANTLGHNISSATSDRDTFLKQEEANLDAAHPGMATQINQWLETMSGLGPRGVSPEEALIANHLAEIQGNPVPYGDPSNPMGFTQQQTPEEAAAAAQSYGLTGVEMQGLGLTPPPDATWAAPPPVNINIPQPQEKEDWAGAMKDMQEGKTGAPAKDLDPFDYHVNWGTPLRFL